MSATASTVNLDKLRHTVQKFGAHSFTTHQVASDYQYGEGQVSREDVERFEGWLHQHAALLGIQAQSPSPAGHTVWHAV